MKLPERRMLPPSELKNLIGMTVWISDYWLKNHWAVVVGCDEYSVVFRTENETLRLMNCVWRVNWTTWNRPPDCMLNWEKGAK